MKKVLITICYHIGKKSKRFRKWYYKKFNNTYLWGITHFLIDKFNIICEGKCSLTEEEFNKFLNDFK